MIFDFKTQVLKLRKGECDLGYKYKDSKSSVAEADYFPGKFISNCVIAFILVTTIFTLAGAILFHPLFWELIWEHRNKILIFLIPYLITLIKDLIIKKLCYDKPNDLVKRPL